METRDTRDRHLPQVALLVLLLLAAGCGGDKADVGAPPGPPEKLRIGAFKGEISGLVWIAEIEGYFTKRGIDAQVTGFDTGVKSVEELVAGRLDISTGSDFVYVSQTLAGEGGLRVLAAIARSDSIEVLARTASGIASPADLKGKKIGVTRKSAAEYYLHLFLLYQNIDPRSVTIVDLPGPQLVKAITEGSVDAVATVNPSAGNIRQAMGRAILSWPAQGNQQFYQLLLCGADFAEKRPEAARRLIRALNDAESLVRRDPAGARRILARRLALEEGYLATIWPRHDLGLSLDQALLVTLEDEARWAAAQGFAPAGRPVNYLKGLSPGPLAAVRPDAVTLYR